MDGIVEGVRSEAMAVPMISAQGENIYALIAGATLVEAAYDAFATKGGQDISQTHSWQLLCCLVHVVPPGVTKTIDGDIFGCRCGCAVHSKMKGWLGLAQFHIPFRTDGEHTVAKCHRSTLGELLRPIHSAARDARIGLRRAVSSGRPRGIRRRPEQVQQSGGHDVVSGTNVAV
jgi:hypothetical protein